jgi:predicted extracellular nuclease
MDGSTNSDAATDAPAEVNKEPINNATSAGSSINSCPFEKPLTNSLTVETTAEMTAMSVQDHSNTETALNTVGEVTPTSEPNIKDCTKTTTDYLPLNDI